MTGVVHAVVAPVVGASRGVIVRGAVALVAVVRVAVVVVATVRVAAVRVAAVRVVAAHVAGLISQAPHCIVGVNSRDVSVALRADLSQFPFP